MQFTFGVGARVITGSSPATSFSLAVTSTPTTIAGGAITTPTIKDVILSRDTGATVDSDIKISVSRPINSPFPAPILINRTPTICDVLPSGAVRRKTDGVGIIDIFSRGDQTRTVTNNFLRTVTVKDTFSNYVAGSLALHIKNAIAGMIAGKTPQPGAGGNLMLWDSNNSATGIRNANMFAAGLDLSAIALAWSGGSGTVQAKPLLISPYHIIQAAHYRPTGSCVFKSLSGAYFTANIVGYQQISDDICVGLLNWTSAVPTAADIKFFKFLPANWKTKLPCMSGGAYQLPCLLKVAHNLAQTQLSDEMHLADLTSLDGIDGLYITNGAVVLDAAIAPWRTSTLIGGDSGSPFIFPIDEAGGTNYYPVLLGTAWRSDTSGAHHGNFLPQIQSAMNTISLANAGPAQNLLIANLANFNTY